MSKGSHMTLMLPVVDPALSSKTLRTPLGALFGKYGFNP